MLRVSLCARDLEAERPFYSVRRVLVSIAILSATKFLPLLDTAKRDEKNHSMETPYAIKDYSTKADVRFAALHPFSIFWFRCGSEKAERR